MMKKVLTVILISFIVLSCAHVQEIENNERGKYPADKPLPIIGEFPSAIQRYDSIKAVYYSQVERVEHSDGGISFVEPDLSSEFIEAFASAFISYYMFYYDFPYKGLHWKYISMAAPMGLRMADRLFAMPNPWKFLMESKGVVLGEVIDNKSMNKGGDKWKSSVPYVVKVKIIDDILDSYDEDTLLIRHNSTTLEKYNEEDIQLLFAFKPRSSINQGDTIKQIYTIKGYDSFMYVDKDSIIHDPSQVLGIEGKKYIDYRNELLEFAKEHDIKK